MNRFLNNSNEVPPGGFRYHQEETNFTVTAPSWKDLLQRVKAHRQANVLPIGAQFENEIQNWLCAQIPETSCTDADPNRSPEVPRNDWPLWAKAMALLAKPEDVGIGDVIARTIGPVGGDKFKAWYAATFNRSCGCAERQESFNIQYPLK